VLENLIQQFKLPLMANREVFPKAQERIEQKCSPFILFILFFF